MPNRPGNDDRITGTGDRASASTEGSRQNSGSMGTSSQSASSQNSGARTRSNRGFASMDRSKQKEIASKGGKAAHAKGTAHEFDSGEAREAGRKGGMAVSRNREHMAAIGRRGGEARGHARNRGASQTNTGASQGEGSYQNSRNADRQVAIDNQQEGVHTNTQGTRGGNASIGGERRTAETPRNESFGNH